MVYPSAGGPQHRRDPCPPNLRDITRITFFTHHERIKKKSRRGHWFWNFQAKPTQMQMYSKIQDLDEPAVVERALIFRLDPIDIWNGGGIDFVTQYGGRTRFTLPSPSPTYFPPSLSSFRNGWHPWIPSTSATVRDTCRCGTKHTRSNDDPASIYFVSMPGKEGTGYLWSQL